MASSGELEKVSSVMDKVSIQGQGDGGEEGGMKKVDRHCALCLTFIPGGRVNKLCSKCKRRAYCSKECQVADWKLAKTSLVGNGRIHGYGQGHKNWCGLDYGEEDLDWKVVQIEGKGLGIIALRDISPLSRIIVEGIQSDPVLGEDDQHPGMGVDDPALKPSLLGKNSSLDNYSFGPKVGLRTSRTNHSCDANASCVDDKDFHVIISFSNREIKEGEEICLGYVRFNNDVCKRADENKSPESLRLLLSSKWGIICPPTCPCRDEKKLQLLKMARDLYEECERDYKRKNVLSKMEKVIETARKVGCCPTTISTLHFFAAEYAITHQATLRKGKEYLEMYLKFNQSIYHPCNKEQVVEVEKSLMNFSKPGVLPAEKEKKGKKTVK